MFNCACASRRHELKTKSHMEFRSAVKSQKEYACISRRYFYCMALNSSLVATINTAYVKVFITYPCLAKAYRIDARNSHIDIRYCISLMLVEKKYHSTIHVTENLRSTQILLMSALTESRHLNKMMIPITVNEYARREQLGRDALFEWYIANVTC